MGNRGTTPSWDEEEIRKWGFLGHLENVRRGIEMRTRVSKRRHDSEISKLLALLRALLEAKQQY